MTTTTTTTTTMRKTENLTRLDDLAYRNQGTQRL